MTAHAAAAISVPAPPAAPPRLSDADMAELLGAFNDATGRLHAAHESLRAEVARLQDELRRANEQLERSRRLAALGEMAAGIAHEIRNPLGSIRLYAKMLEDDLAGRDAERATAQRITAAVRTADAVVRDVLAFAKEVRVHPAPILIDDLITRAIDEAMTLAQGPVRIVRHDRASDTTTIHGDEALLHRALVNLISNAVQAMHSEGSHGEGSHGEGIQDQTPAPATLTTAVSTRSVLDARGHARRFIALTISDTGPGIDPAVIERIFNPFFTTRSAGTGLGLAIVHRIVDAHSGRVAIRNADPLPGHAARAGAIAELLLPVEPAQPSSHPQPATAADAPLPPPPRRAPTRVTELAP